MMTILLIVIFISFLGVGLPDSAFGTAWPAIYTEFHLPISMAGYVAMTTSLGTIVSSLLSTGLIRRFGTGVVTAASTVLTVIGLFGFAYAKHPVFFFVCAIPLGIGGGAVDSALNNFMAINYSATKMNFMQCFYGLGVAASPYLMSLALGQGNDWRKGYRTIALIQTGLAVFTMVVLPLWRKVEKSPDKNEEREQKIYGVGELLKQPSVFLSCLVFLFACAVELTAGSWSSTFFVESKDVGKDMAARIAILFYAGLTVGRFVSGVIVKKLGAWKLLKLASILLLVAVVGLALPCSVTVTAVALFFVGLGVGPLFPNLLHLTPVHFGKELSQSVIAMQMAFSYIGIMVIPPLFGAMTGAFSTALYPYFLGMLFVVYAVMLVAMVMCLKKEKKSA